MSRESKIITAYEWGPQATVSHYEAFGWELLSLNGNQITMSRETQNPVYSDLVKLQAQYEEYVNAYNRLSAPKAPAKPARVSAATCFWTFVCLVIPCAVYVTVKVMQFKKYKAALEVYNGEVEAYNNKKKELRAKMEETVLQGRTVFFSKQA